MIPKIVTTLALFSLDEKERAKFYEMDKLDDKHPRHMTFAEFGEIEWKRAGSPQGKKAESWAKRFWEPFEKFWVAIPQPQNPKLPEDARDGIVS